MANERRSRDIDIVKNALDKQRNTGDRDTGDSQREPSSRERRPDRGSGRQIMYRGKPVNGRGSGGAPGSPSSTSAARKRPAARDSGAGDDIKIALRKITTLFQDGLITKAEYENKRAEILDRL